MKHNQKYTEEEKIDIAAAEVMGQQAFVNGKMAAPALDQNAMDLVKKYSSSDFSHSNVVLAILKSWNRGWHTANSVADIQ